MPQKSRMSEQLSSSVRRDWRSAIDRLAGAYADSTLRAYRSDFSAFDEWCNSIGQVALPAEPETVAAFIEHDAIMSSPATGHPKNSPSAAAREPGRRRRRRHCDASSAANKASATEAGPRTDARLARPTHRIVFRHSAWQTRSGPHRRRIRHAVSALGTHLPKKGRPFAA